MLRIKVTAIRSEISVYKNFVGGKQKYEKEKKKKESIIASIVVCNLQKMPLHWPIFICPLKVHLINIGQFTLGMLIKKLNYEFSF